MLNNYFVKYFGFFIVSFVLFSCSSDDTGETCCDVYPIETRKFVSKIQFDSSLGASDVFYYNYNSDNNLTSIEKNYTQVSFIYNENKISRVEISDNTTGEILNYINYFYNNVGQLDYFEGNYLLRVVRYEYENDRVVRMYRYNTITDLNNNQYVRLTDVEYNDGTKNVFEYKDYSFNGNLIKRGTRSYGIEDKRFYGEAAALIDLPSGNNIIESFSYYSNYNLKAWKTSINSNELELYRESFYENDTDDYCINWEMVYYNASGDITKTENRLYEYIELEIN